MVKFNRHFPEGSLMMHDWDSSVHYMYIIYLPTSKAYEVNVVWYQKQYGFLRFVKSAIFISTPPTIEKLFVYVEVVVKGKYLVVYIDTRIHNHPLCHDNTIIAVFHHTLYGKISLKWNYNYKSSVSFLLILNSPFILVVSSLVTKRKR